MKFQSALLLLGTLISAAFTSMADTHYVNLNNASPVLPYTNWNSAALTIQDAVDASVDGDTILVTNGLYGVGGRAVYGTMTNRLAITKAVSVLSVNGPTFTSIAGRIAPGTSGNGNGAIRCVYVGTNALLSGFTLTNGHTRAIGDAEKERSGGGAWCEGSGVLTNCTLNRNSASSLGGGAYAGALNNCTLIGNSAGSGGGAASNILSNCMLTNNSASSYGGGAYAGALNNCTLIGNSANSGGGAASNILSNCMLTSNSASSYGGGAYGGTLITCALTGNSSVSQGGGARFATLTSCLITSNSSYSGGGSASSTLNNCIFIGNSATYGGGSYSSTLNNCMVKGNLASSGGGAYGGTLGSCAITGNSAGYGGGADNATLNNCTLTGNRAYPSGGGTSVSMVNNCILYYNTASDGNYDSGSVLNFCCTTPKPSGSNNFTVEPGLASVSHLSAGSPCRGVGSVSYAMGLDIDGETWANLPSVGCDEYWTGSVTGPVGAAILTDYTNVSTGFSVNFQADISGRVSDSAWDFDDGTVVSNRPYASHAWSTAGDYAVVLRAWNESFPAGVAVTATVHIVTQPVHYVAQSSSSPLSPYASWATAATNIQDAVDVATTPGALVLVSNGVYQSGTRALYGMNNRVAVGREVTVQSVNGAGVTVIQGTQVPGTTNGASAVRCAYLTNGAVLSGFTLTGGATQISGDTQKQQSGGAAWCESISALLTNCILVGNSASAGGGGSYYGTLNNCALTGNSATNGGGAYYSALSNCMLSGNFAISEGGAVVHGSLANCTLLTNSAFYGGGASESLLNNCSLTGNSAYFGGGTWYGSLKNCALLGNSATGGGGASSSILNNCTLTWNWAFSGGGTSDCTLSNCIVYYNTASDGNYDASSELNFCCTTPLPASGNGNLSFDPSLAGLWHLSAGSPCRGAGLAAYASGLDLDGQPWASQPSIGCDEYWAGSITGALSLNIVVDYTTVALGFSLDLKADIAGLVSDSSWDFGDGVVVSNRPYVSHAWSTVGDYTVVLRAWNESFPAGVVATAAVHVVAQPVHYVAQSSSSPLPPYNSWATAATNIQDAVDAALEGGALVLVSNGVYRSGSKIVYGVSNRVAVTRAIVVQSVNGPGLTMVQGYQVPGTTNGASAVRCAYLTNGALLSGFTLTNGATPVSGDAYKQRSGGGVWCEPINALVTNCTIIGNSASDSGGGACYGTLRNCVITKNLASGGGGAYYATLINCTIASNRAVVGGGTDQGILNDCTLTNNSASYQGGGATDGTLNNCTLAGNSSGQYGGGAAECTLNGCTLRTNYSAYEGGGVYRVSLNNCAIMGNSSVSDGGGANNCTLNYCALTGNSTSQNGGGSAYSTLNNCIVTGNSASYGGGDFYDTLYNCTLIGNSASNFGGGAHSGTLNNCTVFFNGAPNGSNYYQGALNYCCTKPLPPGLGNIATDPLFINTNGWANLRLQANSPCINAGRNAYVSLLTDLDNNPRIAGGTVDMGAYEYQSPGSRISYAWLQSYGFPTDGSADNADPDLDGMNNWQEWIAGTDPTNPASLLRMLSPIVQVPGLLLAWTSNTNRTYFLERATNLTTPSAFLLIQSNLPGKTSSTTFTDTNPPPATTLFYRVGLQE
jgi:hypothetical protein